MQEATIQVEEPVVMLLRYVLHQLKEALHQENRKDQNRDPIIRVEIPVLKEVAEVQDK